MSRKTLILVALFVSIAGISAWQVFGHCQVPCGIYNDPARFVLLEEHATTIEKSMKEIERLSKEGAPNYNQIVRWVQNKDDHADELSSIVTYYFMAQRVKPVMQDQGEAYDKYIRELTLLHGMVVHAMKAKQTVDLDEVAKLRGLIAEFKASYLGEEADHDHK